MNSGHDRTLRWAVALLIGVMAISGCGDAGKKPVAKVSGKVTFNGQAVTGGTITLAPRASANSSEAGTPARCSVQSDGSFKASTYGQFDGAIIGKHQVMYSPPSVETPVAPAGGHAQAPPPSPFEGLVAKVVEIEVKAGENSLSIELVKGEAAAAGQATPANAHSK